MKNYTLLFAVLFLASCQYDHLGEPTEKTPTSFTQKALVELFNGAWCGFSPDGDYMVKEVKQFVPNDRYDYIQYHLADQMATQEDDAIEQVFSGNGVPMGMVNRIGGESHSRFSGSLPNYSSYDPQKNNAFLIRTKEVLATEAACGLAIDATSSSGSEVEVVVKLAIGPEALPEGNYYISVIAYEREMSGTGTGWDYVNWFSKDANAVFGSSHPHYNDPNPIVGYVHTNAVRSVLTDNALGDKLDSTALQGGVLTTYNYTLDHKDMDSDLRFAAFIYQYDILQLNKKVVIQNVQFVDLGQNQPFD